jgi:hypothetical protein
MPALSAIKRIGEGKVAAHFKALRLHRFRTNKKDLIQDNLVNVLARIQTGHHPN